MGEAKRTVIVHAYDDDDEDCGVGFGMSGYGVRQNEIHCKKDNPKHRMKKSDPHTIIFELANRSSRDLRFPKDPDDAMWVAADDQSCPEDPCHQKQVVFGVNVSSDGEQLTVKNHNKDKKRFAFTLNFHETKDGKTVRVPFDPIWANNNGGLA